MNNPDPSTTPPDPPMRPCDFIVYTYRTVDGGTVCEAYGTASQADCETAAAKLKTEVPGLTTMVLPLEAMPS